MSFTLEEMTTQIQSQLGLPYDKARAVAESNMARHAPQPAADAKTRVQGHSGVASAAGGVSGAIPAKQSLSKNLTVGEKSEQLAIKNSAIARGAFVYEFSQARATNQTPGIPDLYLVWPTHGLWWECKTPTGVLSQAQLKFGIQMTKAGIPYGSGTHQDFLDWCTAKGVLA